MTLFLITFAVAAEDVDAWTAARLMGTGANIGNVKFLNTNHADPPSIMAAS